MYAPLAPVGLAFATASTNALTFSISCSSLKDALPTPACTTPPFSALNCTSPPFAACTAALTSTVTVPTFGFGMRFLGPKTNPNRPTTGIISGVAIQRSNSIVPDCTVCIRSSAPTMSAPAALASSALASLANTATRTDLPVPFGKPTTPRTI